MIATFGYYVLFLFNVLLTAFLSLIIYYLNNKDNRDGDLNFFSTLSIIIDSLVTVSGNYTSMTESTTVILPIMVISIFIFLGLFIHRNIKSKQELTTYMLFIFVPVLIGMGFYVSTLSTIIIIFSMRYFFNGVFNFFTDHKEELVEDNDENIIGLDDQDESLLDLDISNEQINNENE